MSRSVEYAAASLVYVFCYIFVCLLMLCYVFTFHTVTVRDLDYTLARCNYGLSAAFDMHEELFRLGILANDRLELLHLEDSLLKLAAMKGKQLCKGIFYCLVMPVDLEGESYIRLKILESL